MIKSSIGTSASDMMVKWLIAPISNSAGGAISHDDLLLLLFISLYMWTIIYRNHLGLRTYHSIETVMKESVNFAIKYLFKITYIVLQQNIVCNLKFT